MSDSAAPLETAPTVALPIKPRTGSEETGAEQTITTTFHPFSADLVRSMAAL
jgi:hypothetical protein